MAYFVKWPLVALVMVVGGLLARTATASVRLYPWFCESGQTEAKPLPSGQAGVSLWVGDRAEEDNRIVMLGEGTRRLTARLYFENRLGREIPAGADVLFRMTDVFTGEVFYHKTPLGKSIATGGRDKTSLEIELPELRPSYYHVLADVLERGRTLVGTRKGSDDFYVRGKKETMTYAMLSLRTGMASWLEDRVYGGFISATVGAALPHCYDPLSRDPEMHGEFMRHFAQDTQKICEGYEAGVTGIALAAEAFRRCRDRTRCVFAEQMMWRACEAMFPMQDECGGAVAIFDQMGDHGVFGKHRSWPPNLYYNSDQTDEWMQALAYASLYYQRRGHEPDKVRRLNEACRRAGDFLVRESTAETNGIACVLRNYFRLVLKDDGTFERKPYWCEVYQPRLVSGLAISAVALLRAGDRVPDAWWKTLDASTKWMELQMGPNGHFDRKCDSSVEGGCHSFLGNIYAAEGFFFTGLANRLAKRKADNGAVFKAAHRAYRFVTDDCYVKGKKYEYPLEFWVGPYVYWLFTEWLHDVGDEPVFKDWLTTLDRKWRIEREWGDFMRVPGMACGRNLTNGMLTAAILGYLGIRQMEEIGKPWTLVD